MALVFWKAKAKMRTKTGTRSKIPSSAVWSNAWSNGKFWGEDTYKIASLDTLFIMGFAKEYKTTKDEILANFKNSSVRADPLVRKHKYIKIKNINIYQITWLHFSYDAL